MPGSSEVSQLVQASANGDEQAWNELVHRYAPLVMAVARTCQLLRAELGRAPRDGLSELPPRDQRLLRLRAGDPPASYHDISQLLGYRPGASAPRCGGARKSSGGPRPRAHPWPSGLVSGVKGGGRRELAEME